MDTFRYTLLVDTDDPENKLDELASLGAYDIEYEEEEPPKVLRHTQQKKPKP